MTYVLNVMHYKTKHIHTYVEEKNLTETLYLTHVQMLVIDLLYANCFAMLWNAESVMDKVA